MDGDPCRFDCPSACLNLAGLLRHAGRVLWAGLSLALGIHLAFSQFRALGEEKVSVKPLTTRFIKRQPRLSKPLEMKKRPRPKRRRLKRHMVAVKAKAGRQDLGSRIGLSQIVGRLPKPAVEVPRAAGSRPVGLEPKAFAQKVLGDMSGKRVVEAALEMVDIEALDTGRYQAMVIQDPTDRQGIRGYFHLYPVYIESAAEAERRSPYGEGTPFAFPGAIRNLVQAMNLYTDIRTDVGKVLSLDSADVHKVPIIFVSYHIPFHASPSELRNVGEYLMGGGFLFSDTLYYNARVVFDNIRILWRDALGWVGKAYGTDWNFEHIPQGHPLFHCYFDFGGPPAGLEIMYTRDKWAKVDYHDGVFIDGRLLGICTCKNYWNLWWKGPELGHIRQLQFGVNIIIFALTQEGSITNQVMERVQ